MICPYSKERINCFKFGPYTVPPGSCCKCNVPNPIKAEYFHMPKLDDGERYGVSKCGMCGRPIPKDDHLCSHCAWWLRQGQT